MGRNDPEIWVLHEDNNPGAHERFPGILLDDRSLPAVSFQSPILSISGLSSSAAHRGSHVRRRIRLLCGARGDLKIVIPQSRRYRQPLGESLRSVPPNLIHHNVYN